MPDQITFECTASALNLRIEPRGDIVAELRLGDLFDVEAANASVEWVSGTVRTGVSAGKSGCVRRKWLIQHFDVPPKLPAGGRKAVAKIVADRTAQFDGVKYGLGFKADTWSDLSRNQRIDCSGWIYLLGADILAQASGKKLAALLATYSDQQIVNVGRKTKRIISGRFLRDEHFVPGVIVGIDFAEYSWDRGRPLDIDHIVTIGADGNGPFVSQSSSSGAGVNAVPLDKWLGSQRSLIDAGRVHVVDLLSLP